MRTIPTTSTLIAYILLCLLSNRSKSSSTDLDALHERAIASHRDKRHSDALGQITTAIMLMYDAEQQTIHRSPASSNLFNSKGVIHKGAYDFASALLSFDLAVELDDMGSNYNAYYNRANTLHYNLCNALEATGDDALTKSVQDAFLSSLSRQGLSGPLQDRLLEAAAQDYAVADGILLRNKDPQYDYASFANDYAICLRKLGKTNAAIEVLLRAVEHSPQNLFTRGNLVLAFKDVGALREAAEHSRVAIEIDPNNGQVRHNYGLVLQEMGQSGREQWEIALRLDPDIFYSQSSIGHDEGNRGNLTGAVHHYKVALETAIRVGAFEEVGSLKLQIATGCIPPIYQSLFHIEQVRDTFLINLSRILGQVVNESTTIYDPLTSTGSGALGYYIIYQGKVRHSESRSDELK